VGLDNTSTQRHGIGHVAHHAIMPPSSSATAPPTRPFLHAAADRLQPPLPQRAARRFLLLREASPARNGRSSRRPRHVRSNRRRLRCCHRRRGSNKLSFWSAPHICGKSSAENAKKRREYQHALDMSNFHHNDTRRSYGIRAMVKAAAATAAAIKPPHCVVLFDILTGLFVRPSSQVISSHLNSLTLPSVTLYHESHSALGPHSVSPFFLTLSPLL